MVKCLIEDHHANIEATKDSKPWEGCTPLAVAAACGHLKTLQSLIDMKADTGVLNREGQNLLQIAANQGRKDIVEYLIQTGSQIGDQNASTKDTALHYAISKGHKEVAGYLIDRTQSILEIPNKKNQTPLHTAVISKRPGMVKLLLSHKVETKVKDELGKTPLQHAMDIQDDNGNVSLAILEEFLAQHRPGVYFVRDFHALSHAIRDNKLQHVEKIVGKDPSLITVLPASESGLYPALHEAVRNGRASIVKLLGRCSETNPNLADRNGQTPLHHAILKGQDKMLDALLAMGADVTRTDTKNGYYPLHYAAQQQNFSAMKKLVERGAKPKIRIPGPACQFYKAKGISTMDARCLLVNLPENKRKKEFNEMKNFLRDAMKR